MATFTALANILCLKNYYNTKIAGLGEKIYPTKIFSYTVMTNGAWSILYLIIKIILYLNINILLGWLSSTPGKECYRGVIASYMYRTYISAANIIAVALITIVHGVAQW